jgi:2,4-dienoyl-CoA reductase-like NADH-dependent reductase (Old Yellow Enzyme family)
MTTQLFTPFTLRNLTLKNRIVIAPMCTYSAIDGKASDWHLAHLGKFALGGAAAILTEAAAVQEHGRITHGDLGIWSDEHAAALKPVIAFLRANGAAAGVQIAHAGRKASMQRPWFGNGPLTGEDEARGDMPWDIAGPSATALDEGWLTPAEITDTEIRTLIDDFAAAARRCDAIGCDFIEIHGAHGYLLQSFLSPLSNHRDDDWGGDLARRMAVPLVVTKAVRAVWPKEKPLFFRISSVDGVVGGWSMDDSVALAAELKTIGIDVIDCSSLGNTSQGATAAPGPRGVGFQTPFSARIRKEVGIATQAVGLITDGPTAEAILAEGRADLIAIGREALYDPFWPNHQAHAMGVEGYDGWPEPYGWWLQRREGALRRIKSDPVLSQLPPTDS